MCEITGVKRNRLNYIVITQTLFYNYTTRTSLKSFSFYDFKQSTAPVKAIIFSRLFLVGLERISI